MLLGSIQIVSTVVHPEVLRAGVQDRVMQNDLMRRVLANRILIGVEGRCIMKVGLFHTGVFRRILLFIGQWLKPIEGGVVAQLQVF